MSLIIRLISDELSYQLSYPNRVQVISLNQKYTPSD